MTQADASPRLTFWFEFASTYSYLSVQRAEALAQAQGVTLVWRPFLLGPVFAALGWKATPFVQIPAKGAYMWRDLERRAARLGLPAPRRLESFPQNGLRAARVATALPQDALPPFARALFLAQFHRGELISDAPVIAAALEAAGQDPAAALARGESAEAKAALRAATERAQALNLFGAPSFETEDGEIFWGDDRLEDALDWAAGRR